MTRGQIIRDAWAHGHNPEMAHDVTLLALLLLLTVTLAVMAYTAWSAR